MGNRDKPIASPNGSQYPILVVGGKTIPRLYHSALCDPGNSGRVRNARIAIGEYDAIAPQALGSVKSEIGACNDVCEGASVLDGRRHADAHSSADPLPVNKPCVVLESAADAPRYGQG